MPAYSGYKLYLVNSKQQMNTDIYPISLLDAIQRSTFFEASWIPNSVSIPPTTSTINAFGAQGKGGGKTPDVKDKKDGIDKLGGNIKFEGECFNCGKYGHRKADCRRPRQRPNRPQIRDIPKRHSPKVRQTNISRFTQLLAQCQMMATRNMMVIPVGVTSQ